MTELENNSDGEELSIRDSINNAIKEVTGEEVVTDDKPKPAERVRDESGKFAKTEKPEAQEPVKAVEEPKQEAAKTLEPPKSWSAAAKAKWGLIDPEVQADILRREEEVHKGFTKQDDERAFGKNLKEVITPYLPMIQAEGGNPVAAVQSLLNTAYILRTADGATKRQLLDQLEVQFNIPPKQDLSSNEEYIDPQVKALQDKLAQLEGYINHSQKITKQREQETLQGEIQAFAANPENVHFEAVKAYMAALLDKGQAKDLQEAYNMAIWAHPDIRSTLLNQQKQQSEAERIAEQKAKAEAARNRAVSVRGAPGVAVPNTGNPDRSLREELEANFNAFSV